jgi:hypothetical protein
VIYKRSGFQKHRVHIANRVLFKEYELRLLASLPLRNVLKAIDVPADQRAQFGRRLLCASQGSWVFQGNLAMLAPSLSSAAMGKSLSFLMEHFSLPTDTDYGRVPNRTVGLLSSFDGWHANLTLRGQGIYVPFLSPRQLKNSPESAEISQKRLAWKTLEK